jgi:hypothetical protein
VDYRREISTLSQTQQGAYLMDVQSLFDHFNREYWGGRLPHYTVVLTDKFIGGHCETAKSKRGQST